MAARLVAMTEGENHVSFDALNLWASKRGHRKPEQNRTAESAPLELMGARIRHANTAVAAGGLSPPYYLIGNANNTMKKEGIE